MECGVSKEVKMKQGSAVLGVLVHRQEADVYLKEGNLHCQLGYSVTSCLNLHIVQSCV